MGTTDTEQHWQQRWSNHDHGEMGWFQAEPEPSLELVTTHTPGGGRVLDVGGGASLLADRLLARSYKPTVLDLAEPALTAARERLGSRADDVRWVRGDVTEIRLDMTFDTWHDRAVLHFLLTEQDRAAYLESVRRHLRPEGHVVVGTFAPDGPTTCSGLPVRRHSAADLHELFGEEFSPVSDRAVTHVKPSGDEQSFVFVVMRRNG